MKKLIAAIGFLLYAVLSCEQHETINVPLPDKTQLGDQRTISVEEAKQYYTSSVITNSPYRIPTINKTERDVNWNDAKKVTQENGLEVIVAPISYKTKNRPGILFWNNNTEEAKKLPTKENMLEAQESYLTFKDKSGIIHSQIVQFFASKEYKQKNKEKISNKDFTGWIVAMTWDEKLITGFEFKNGKDVRQLLTSASNEEAKARLSSCEYTYSQSVSASCNTCGSNMTCCDVYISGSYQGTCTGPSSNSGTDNNYGIVYGGVTGGGGAYSYTPPSQQGLTAVDITTDPTVSGCVKSVLDKMGTSYMNSYLGNQFVKLYGENAGTKNFRFKAGTTSPDAIAEYKYGENVIVIDQSKVGQSSQEFIASVIAHELAHVIITEYQTTGIVPPSQYEQHMDIFENMVLQISNIITSAYPPWDYPGLAANNYQDAKALALGGIADVLEDKNHNILPKMDEMAVSKYNMTIAQASAIIQTYKNGTKGTQCGQ